MTLTFELDLDKVKIYHQSKYLSQRSFSSKVVVLADTDSHSGPSALPRALKWWTKIAAAVFLCLSHCIYSAEARPV